MKQNKSSQTDLIETASHTTEKAQKKSQLFFLASNFQCSKSGMKSQRSQYQHKHFSSNAEWFAIHVHFIAQLSLFLFLLRNFRRNIRGKSYWNEE